MGAAALAALIGAPSGGLSALRSLNLRRNSIGDAGAEALAAVASHAVLATLNLANNDIGAAGAAALAEKAGSRRR